MNTGNISAQDYLSKVVGRLKQQEYNIKENITYDNQVFEYIAKRTKFEVQKGGLFATFFLFAKFTVPDIPALKDFSSKAFRYARKTSGIHPPRGLFYGMSCFPVAIVESLDHNTINFIHKTEPPKHWAASEKLVAFCLEGNTLYYCEATFYWGSWYYDRDRMIINKMLSY